MKRGSVLFVWILLLGCLPVKAQIDSVAVCMDRIKAAGTDSAKLLCADRILVFLDSVKFGAYAEKPPVKYLGYKKCSNSEVELFSWVVPLQTGEAFYNLFRFGERGKNCLVKSLPEDKNAGWLYYDLLAFQSSKKEYFVLLGWNRTKNSNRKIIQTVSFENGLVGFNHPLMRRGNSRSASLSFEYASDGSMMLKHDKKGKRIIFDHLAPVDKKYEGYFMFYGPDASYDALILKGGEWWYQENVKS